MKVNRDSLPEVRWSCLWSLIAKARHLLLKVLSAPIGGLEPNAMESQMASALSILFLVAYDFVWT